MLSLLLLGVLLVGAGTLAREGLRALLTPSSVRPDYVYRRDPVRDLADAQREQLPLATGADVALGDREADRHP